MYVVGTQFVIIVGNNQLMIRLSEIHAQFTTISNEPKYLFYFENIE